MDVSQQFCLRWNNYQSTLHHIFHKLWSNGTFVDVSLVVEGRRIDCHKVILSACSTYFEQLLSEHSSHPHPLVLLHDIPFSAVESLVTFMYKGEINVSHAQLTALLKVAESLKIKGLADSAAISNFTKYHRLARDVLKIPSSQYSYPVSTVPTSSPPFPATVPVVNGNSAARCYSVPIAKGTHNPTSLNGPTKRPEQHHHHNSSVPHRKRPRHDESPASLPPSPPISLEEPHSSEHIKSSPQENYHVPSEVRADLEEETDTELQIDESVGPSPSESAESDTHSSRNTPVLDAEIQEQNERIETAQSLAALATSGTLNLLSHQAQPQTQQQQSQPHQLLAPKPRHRAIKEEKSTTGNGKNGERSYTMRDLEDGIEAVLIGQLTPAKAIAKYRVPRRTFFRRLSAVRKSRGIPSSKENASEHYLNGGKNSPPVSQTPDNKNQMPLIIPGIVSDETSILQNLSKCPKVIAENAKKEKKPPGLNLSSGNVFSLLNVTANPSYEYYLKYLKMQTHGKDVAVVSEDKRQSTMDGNRNLAPEVSDQALALVTQNGSVK